MLILVECDKGTERYRPVAIIGMGEWEAYKLWRAEGYTLLSSTPEEMAMSVRDQEYRYRWRRLLFDPHQHQIPRQLL